MPPYESAPSTFQPAPSSGSPAPSLSEPLEGSPDPLPIPAKKPPAPGDKGFQRQPQTYRESDRSWDMADADANSTVLPSNGWRPSHTSAHAQAAVNRVRLEPLVAHAAALDGFVSRSDDRAAD